LTLDEFFRAAYRFAEHNHITLLLGFGLAFPVVATLLAWIGRGGKTDRDGKFIASLFLGVAIIALVAELVGLWVATSIYRVNVMHAPVALLVAPLLGFVLTLVGIRWVFPLNQLATARTAGDLALLALLCGGLIWFFSKFHGWGIIFFGGILQLVLILGVVLWFIRRIFKRAFGAGPTRR
jgi:hypothetical protein